MIENALEHLQLVIIFVFFFFFLYPFRIELFETIAYLIRKKLNSFMIKRHINWGLAVYGGLLFYFLFLVSF